MKRFEYQSKNKHFKASAIFYNFSESKQNLKDKIKHFKLSWPITIKIDK